MSTCCGSAQDPDRRQDPGTRRHDHRGHLERLGQGAGVQGAGAAEGDQRQPSGVDATLDAHHPDGLLHGGVDDGDHALGVDPGVAQRRLGRVTVEGVEPGEGGALRDPARDEVGVGDGRTPTPVAVAGRTGPGPCALGPDDQRATVVEVGDRTPAGADRVDVERREPDRQAGHLALTGRRRATVEHEAHVGGRPAHVEGDGVGEPVGDRDRGAGQHPTGRTREQQRRRTFGGIGRPARARRPTSSPAPTPPTASRPRR